MIELTFLTDHVLALSNVLSPDECHEQITRAQLAGFDAQAYGQRRASDVRRRAVRDDANSAAWLWERIAPHLPPLERFYRPPVEPDPPVSSLSAFAPVGLNPRLRYYRYEPGERFPRHFDIAYEETPTRRSFLTLIVYLNEEYEGGETRFGDLAVNARAGMAILFPHELRHEGCEVLAGAKCVLRSDVMYQLCSPAAENIGAGQQ